VMMRVVYNLMTAENSEQILQILETISNAPNRDVFDRIVTEKPRLFLRLLKEPFFQKVSCSPSEHNMTTTTTSALQLTSFLWEILLLLRSNHKKILIFDGRNAPRNTRFISQLNRALMHESDTLVITIDNDGFNQIDARLFFSMRMKCEDDDLVICMIYKWLHDLIEVTIVTNDKSEIRPRNIERIAATSPYWKDDKVQGFSSVRTMTFREYLLLYGMVCDYSASQPASLNDVRGGSVRGGDASSPSPSHPALASSPSPPALSSHRSFVQPRGCYHCGELGHKKFQCPHQHVPSKLSVIVDANSLSAASAASTATSTPASTPASTPPNKAQEFLAKVAAKGNLKPPPKAGDIAKK